MKEKQKTRSKRPSLKPFKNVLLNYERDRAAMQEAQTGAPDAATETTLSNILLKISAIS